MVRREEGQREAEEQWKVRKAKLHEFISPLSCVRGTSSEPIMAVTRCQRAVLVWVLASGAVWLPV